jgi:hypothetical protein
MKELTSGAHFSTIVRGGEGGAMQRHKPKGKTHSCEGSMWHAGLLGRAREAAAQEGVGKRRRPRPVGPDSKESLKIDLIF